MTVKKNLHDMYNRLDRIPAYDGRTDRRSDERTDVHGIVRAMHTRCAVKTEIRRAVRTSPNGVVKPVRAYSDIAAYNKDNVDLLVGTLRPFADHGMGT